MFNLLEVRLLIYSMTKTIENFKGRIKILDEESDDYANIANDLMLCDIVMDKLRQDEARIQESLRSSK